MKDVFESLFGLKSKDIKENCILLPLVNKEILVNFQVAKALSRGKLYSSLSTDKFTLIHTGVGAGLTADAVLYLKDTAARNLVLFGSCGLTEEKNGLGIASLVSPHKCYSYESFSDMLLKKEKEPDLFYPAKTFCLPEVKEVISATLGSLKLEEGMSDLFRNKEIDVVEMEASAFFCASNYIGIKSAALFYISDIIKLKPFYTKFDASLKLKISLAIKSACKLICESFKKNPGA